MKTIRFPKMIHVVQERPPHDEPYWRIAPCGIEDDEIQPGQQMAIYALTKIVTLKQKRWVE